MASKVLVDTDSTQTLSNKTFSDSDVLSTDPEFSGTITGTYTIGGTPEGSAIQVLATGSTTTRSLATRFTDWDNALDHGCVADGVTNNTAAILAFPSEPIYFPPGTYVISTDANGSGLQNNKFFGFGGVKLTEGGANRTQTQTAYGFGALANDTGWDSANPSITGKNTAFGTRALAANTSGYHNVAVGDEALRLNTTGQQNTAVGLNCLNVNLVGRDNTAVGTSALLNTTGSFNTAVGRGAGLANTVGENNTYVGRDAGNLTDGDNNTLIGMDVLHSAAAAMSECTLVGYHSGYTALGDRATTLGNNNGGNGSGNNITDTVLIGYHAGFVNDVVQTVAIGASSCDALTTGLRTTAVGYNTLGALTTAADNTAIGWQAGLTITGLGNTYVGSQAGSGSATPSGDNNTAVGAAAGGSLSTGSRNVLVGQSTGSNLTTGADNTLIGRNLGALAVGTSNQLSILAGTALLTNKADGIAFYTTTNTTDGEAHIPSRQMFRLTADGSAITTIANFFGTTSNISLVASAYYHIDIYLYFLKTTAEALTISLINSAAPTSQNIFWEMSPITGIVAPPGTATLLSGNFSKDATATRTIVTGSLTTAVDHYIHIKIELQNGAGTSLKIQATNPAGSITPRLNSYWTSTRIPTGNTGTFAA